MSEDTLAPLKDGVVPKTVDELWAGYDPRAEPLDVEILKEWEEDGIVLMVLRYRVGVFKGKKAMMAAVYGYPKGGENLPGLVQIHGGGQYAHYQACLTNAKRGYATISIAWAGRLAASDYHVNPEVVKLFWEGETNNPQYRVTTHWGAIDAYHAPCRDEGNNFVLNPPSGSTIDDIPSPRNSGWFPCTMGARRALTFLESRPEVDNNRLGVYGHSMGGKLTVLTAGSDDRVKAAAPSCGGISDTGDKGAEFRDALADAGYLKRISCPIAFLKPANDFHGHIEDLKPAIELIQTDEWRAACAAHHNHQDNAESEVMTQLWMDQHLKGTFRCPETPGFTVGLNRGSTTLSAIVRPDTSCAIRSVDVFYTQQAEPEGNANAMQHTIARFWHHAPAVRDGDVWKASMPLMTTDKPLWAYANIVYELDEPVSGVGYYYGAYTANAFNLSSLMHTSSPEELASTGVKASMKPSLLIEDFDGDWEKEWFTYRPQEWGRRTHKVYDQKWKAPEGASLSFEVRSEQPNKLVVGIDDFVAEIDLIGGSDWQAVNLSAADFTDATGDPLTGWDEIRQLRLMHKDILRERVEGEQESRTVGGEWAGADPAFRDLTWVVSD